mmetsp:Transcript_43635/g.110509  ORF Transcript_43635/g.110509 Transcript_43635/m.110509 type:complete len:295 (+) Transcript_43635:60-944(+)
MHAQTCARCWSRRMSGLSTFVAPIVLFLLFLLGGWLGLRHHGDLANLGLEEAQRRLHKLALEAKLHALGPGSRELRLVFAEPLVDAVLHVVHRVLGRDLDGPDGDQLAIAAVHQDPDLALSNLLLLEALALQLALALPLLGVGAGPRGALRPHTAGEEAVDLPFGDEVRLDLLLHAQQELGQEEAVDGHCMLVCEGRLLDIGDGIRHQLREMLPRRRDCLELQQDLSLPLADEAPLRHDLLLRVPECSLGLDLRLPVLHHGLLPVHPLVLELVHATQLMLFLDLHHGLLQGLVD